MLEINHPELLFRNQKVFAKSRQKLPENDYPKAKDVLVIFFERNNEWLQEWEEMLHKLVTACGFNPQNIWRINAATERFSLQEIQAKVEPKLILLFGDFPITNNMTNIPGNSPFHISGSVLIKTLDFRGLLTDKNQKSKLWGALQSGLNLKK